jgi:hypothetical protein
MGAILKVVEIGLIASHTEQQLGPLYGRLFMS